MFFHSTQKQRSLRTKAIVVFVITLFLILGSLFASLGKLRDQVLQNAALATRELSTIANKTATRAEFTVTSDNVRQKANAPDSFEKAAIAAFSADKSTKYVTEYDGDFYRYARPLIIKEGCLKCHGDPKDAPPAVIKNMAIKRHSITKLVTSVESFL